MVLLDALLLDEVSHRETLLPVDFLDKVVTKVAVVRMQLANWHGPIGNVRPLVCASRFCYFSSRVASSFGSTVQLVLHSVVWPRLCFCLQQGRACLPGHHLVRNLLPSSYLPHPINGAFSILKICLSLGALFVCFLGHCFKVLVEVSSSASFRLARLGDVPVGWILGIELLMRHREVNSFFEYLIKMLLGYIY